jgi:hypothetical protein
MENLRRWKCGRTSCFKGEIYEVRPYFFKVKLDGEDTDGYEVEYTQEQYEKDLSDGQIAKYGATNFEESVEAFLWEGTCIASAYYD